jgi:hypothetical protein
LRILGAGVIWRLVILGADGQNCKKNRQPGCIDRPGRLDGRFGIARTFLEVDHELRFELVDVYNETPERLRDLFVSAEEPGLLVGGLGIVLWLHLLHDLSVRGKLG